MNVIELCNWRYATKKMLPCMTVPQDKVNRILEAARLAPSSSGLQPYEILVITDPELRARIMPVAKNQEQIVACSHLLVFAAWDTYTAERIQRVFDQTKRDRGEISPYWENYGKVLQEKYPARGSEVNFQHAACQAYIGLGFALLAAAAEQVDCTPMEGFDPATLDALLGLGAKGLRSVLLLPLGYRDADNDWLVTLNKSRRPAAEFVIETDSTATN